MGDEYLYSSLFVLKGLILVLLLAFIVFLMNPDGSVSLEKMRENFSLLQDFHDHLKDVNYTIPLADQKPQFAFPEYQKNREKILTDLMLKTRMKFTQQYFVGSVMRDGFNATLPNNAMWKGGKIEIGNHIAKLISKESEKGKVPISPRV